MMNLPITSETVIVALFPFVVSYLFPKLAEMTRSVFWHVYMRERVPYEVYRGYLKSFEAKRKTMVVARALFVVSLLFACLFEASKIF